MLDLGAGLGIDSLIAAERVQAGRSGGGSVLGVDLSPKVRTASFIPLITTDYDRSRLLTTYHSASTSLQRRCAMRARALRAAGSPPIRCNQLHSHGNHMAIT